MAPERLKGTAISNSDQQGSSSRHHPYPKIARSDPRPPTDSSCNENAQDDQRILHEYNWELYKGLPPAMQEAIEANLLMRLLLKSGNVSSDACATCLKDRDDVRALLLQGWEKGTFEALRSNSMFLSLGQPTLQDEDTSMLSPPEEPLGDDSPEEFAAHDDTTGLNRLSDSDCTALERASNLALAQAGDENMEIESNHVEYGPTHGLPEETNVTQLGISRSRLTAGRDINVAVNVWRVNHTSDRDERIAEWLFDVVDYRTMHNEVVKKRSKSTGGWFLQSETYGEWCTSPQQRLMWCPGIPGVGKTVMASLVVDHLRTYDEAKTFVGIIYFNYKLRSQQSKLAILEAVSRQLFETCQKHEVRQVFTDLYNSHEKRKSRPTYTELQSILSRTFRHHQSCYLILDAFDEYTAQYSDKQVREVIHDILSLGPNVKLLITSRVLGEMNATFRELGASVQEIIGDDEDMRTYVAERVEILKSNLDFDVSDEFSEQIVEQVIKAARGRFLVAELGMNLLTEQLNLGELEDALRRLPNEIDDTYVRVMELIKTYPEGRRELAMKALMWVAYAHRRLSVRELQHALATNHGRTETNKYVTPLSTITSLCAGLIVVEDMKGHSRSDEERNVLFVHFTTQEFFMKFQFNYFTDAHKTMFSTCVEYLSIIGNHTLPVPFAWDNILLKQRKSHLPFYDYAALNWRHHAITDNKLVPEEVTEFLLRNDRVLDLSWDYTLKDKVDESDGIPEHGGSGVFLAAYHDQAHVLPALFDQMGNFPCTQKQRTPLHIAALAGHTHVVEEVLQLLRARCKHGNSISDVATTPQRGSAEVNAKDDNGRTPIFYAVTRGYEPIVRLLLEHGGVEVDVKDRNGRTPLSHAVRHGHESIVRLLLSQKGIMVDSQDQQGRTPLSYAASNGNESVVRLLLKHGNAGVNAKDNNGQTPFCRAVHEDKETIVKLMLERGGVEVNTRGMGGWTPLWYAIRICRVSIVKLLLDHGVKVNLLDNNHRTPLSFAVLCGYESIVQLLLAHEGVKVDTKDNNGRTPLSYSAEHSRDSITKLLLEHGGVSVDSKDNEGRTPLSHAARGGYKSIVQLLLGREGVEVDSKDNNGRTPFSYAVERGDQTIVKLLLEHGGIDIESKDEDGLTPFWYAIRRRNEPMVKFLLEHGGVKVNAKDDDARSPLSYAAEWDPGEIVSLLLQHPGVDVNLKDNNGQTPLSYAAKTAKDSNVKLLLDHEGVEPEDKDDNGLTPFWHAVRNANVSTVKLLIEHGGVDTNTKDKKGRTPLIFAVVPELTRGTLRKMLDGCFEAIVELLLKHGSVNVNTKDNSGRSAMSHAAHRGWESINRLLLEHGGVEVNSKDNSGQTPLSYAVRRQDEDSESIVKLLRMHGACEADSEDNVSGR